MGFATGFTGGVALTLSVAYLSVLTHQRNRQQQCDLLRMNTHVLNSLADSDPSATARLASANSSATAAASAGQLYYQRPEKPHQPRPTFTEELKARWNTEIEGAVRWAQNKDWAEVRENTEAAASHLWRQAVGSEKVDAATAAVKQTAASVSDSVTAEAQSLRDSVSAAAAGIKTPVVETAAAAGKAVSAKDAEIEAALKKRFNNENDEMKKSVGELLEERYQHKA